MSAGEIDLANLLRGIAKRPELIRGAHIQIENELIDLRDRGMFIGTPANGLAVNYKDRTSGPIRIGTHMAIKMILEALANQIDKQDGEFGE